MSIDRYNNGLEHEKRKTDIDRSRELFNVIAGKLTSDKDFASDGFARDEYSDRLGSLVEALTENTRRSLADVRQFLPELGDFLVLGDGELHRSGFEFNDGTITFPDGKTLDVEIGPHERRSGLYVAKDGIVIPYVVRGNNFVDGIPRLSIEQVRPLPTMRA